MPIVWLERDQNSGFRVVDHATASRNGEPFQAMIERRRYLPNPIARFCTQDLKLATMRSFMLARGHESWTNVIGLRWDEPARVHRLRNSPRRDRWDHAFPLFDARISKIDIMGYWQSSPFDLELQDWEGNCDLCFLKGAAKKERIIRDRPGIADWWIAQERSIGARFRSNGPAYEQLRDRAMQPMLPIVVDEPDDLFDCICGD